MNKADLVTRIAEATGLTKMETEAVVDGVMITIMQALQEGDRVDLRGFGSFSVRKRKPRTARNLHTNEEILVEEHYVPYFKVSREFARIVDTAMKASGTKP